jgi:cobalt-zinc-cadmium efflux system outer membrane protein
MNTPIRHLFGGVLLASIGAGCTHPLDGPSQPLSPQLTSSFLGIDLPAARREAEQPTPPALPRLGQDASLRDCLIYAAWSSPRLEAAFHNWRAALARVPQVSSLPDPKLSYGYFIESIQTRTGPMDQQFALSQTFPWWGLLDAKADAATHAASARWYAYEHARLELFERVTNAWTAAVDLKSEIAITQTTMDLLEDSESIGRTAYEADRMPHDALLRLQVELGRLEDQVLRLRSTEHPRHAALNAAMGRDADAPLALPSQVHASQTPISLKAARARLRSNQPSLHAFDATIASHASESRIAALSGMPRWTLGISTIDLGDPVDPAMSGSSNNPVLATVGLSLPIWRDKYDAAELEATARRLEAAANRAALLDDMHASLTSAIYQRDDAMDRITRYTEALVPRAEDAVAVSSKALAAGTGSVSNVLDTQRTLLALQRTLERSRAEVINNEAIIARLIGSGPETNQ